MRRVLAVIDVQRLFLASRTEYGPLARVDYVALKKLFNPENDPDVIVDAIAYVIVSPQHEDYRFIRFLKKHSYKVMRQFASIDQSSTVNDTGLKIVPKSWTGKMVKDLHSIVLENKYDEYFIVSGSGGFISAVHAIQAQHKPVTVVSFRSSLHQKMAELADVTVVLDNAVLYDENLYKKPETEGEIDG